VGDVEGQVLAMRDATQPPVLQKGASVVLAGNGIDCGRRADHCVAQTDDAGKYRFADVPAGGYGIAFSVPAKEGEPSLQPESRQFDVSAKAVETISVVLLAEGIARPEVPAELAQGGQAGTPGARHDPGLMSNPFFWYFMFNQPWLGGYARPPVLVQGPERTVVVDRSQPAAPSTPGRTYSNYGPAGAPGTKPAPAPIESKGVTRPGGSAALPGGGSGTSGALPDNSKGVARPGQAPSGADDAAAPRTGSGGSSAARPSQPSSPPRVGAGGGSTAGRSPSSGRAAPPRVRVGRR
jgi:hypothetical protein